MATIDLARLTKGEVRMLTGHPRGVSARELFELDRLDDGEEAVVVLAPEGLDTVTPSFVQGMLAGSFSHLGQDRFKRQFDLSRLPQFLRDDFEIGMQRLIRRTRPADLLTPH